LNLYFFMYSGKKFIKNKQKIFDCIEKKGKNNLYEKRMTEKNNIN